MMTSKKIEEVLKTAEELRDSIVVSQKLLFRIGAYTDVEKAIIGLHLIIEGVKMVKEGLEVVKE